jgi:DNA-binding CsgD family transcriptional regulator
MLSREATEMREEGMIYREIGELLGVSVSYVQELISDPDGARAWERKHQLCCEDCGKPVRSDSASRPSRHCVVCQGKAQRVWTEQLIVAAIKRWATLYGEPPSAQSWSSGNASPRDLRRFREGNWPSTTSAVNRFGCWADARAAAGYPVEHANGGKPRNVVSEHEYRELVRMRERGVPFAQAAEHFHISPNTATARYHYAKRRGIA